MVVILTSIVLMVVGIPGYIYMITQLTNYVLPLPSQKKPMETMKVSRPKNMGVITVTTPKNEGFFFEGSHGTRWAPLPVISRVITPGKPNYKAIYRGYNSIYNF